jgi:hypothetical protein
MGRGNKFWQVMYNVKLFLDEFSVNVTQMCAVGWMLSLLLGLVASGLYFLISIAFEQVFFISEVIVVFYLVYL